MSKPTRYAAQQWEMGGLTPSARQLALQIQSLRSRIEALEADQLEQAENGRFCVDAIVRRVEALELAHRIQSGTLTSAERAELGVVTRVQLEAAMLRSTSDARQTAMDELRARVKDLEAAQCYQFRSATEKVPTTRLYSYSVGPAKPLDELGQGHTLVSPEPANAEAQPGELVERVANAIYNVPHDSAAEARAAICAVATWLDRFALHGSGECAQAAKVLRQEVGQ
jgi:hypothetical protein